MPSIDWSNVNALSIVAFILTCLGCVQIPIGIFITNWWSQGYANNSRTYYGVWSREDCSSKGCESGSATTLEGGQEALFISKVFATFTLILSLAALALHIVYAVLRLAIVRTAAIFMLGSAALFGLLSIFVFVGFYNNLTSGSPSLGVAFFFFLIGTIVLLVAAGFTAWASVRKASRFQLADSD